MPRLDACQIRKEHEAVAVEVLQQHGSLRGLAFGGSRRENHRVRFDDVRLRRLFEPPFELIERIRLQIFQLKAIARVFSPQIADIHKKKLLQSI